MSLAGRNVWLTRPAHQIEPWAEALEARGGVVWREPLLEICPPRDRVGAQAALARAQAADLVIATSANAVNGARRLAPEFMPSGTLLAIGPSTAQVFGEASGRDVRYPESGATSENLLSLPELQAIAGRRVVLLSGEGGRNALQNALQENGASVEKIALYRRRPAIIAQPRLEALLSRAEAIVVTSGEAFDHLNALVTGVSGNELLRRLSRAQLVVPSARVLKKAIDEGPDWRQPPVRMDRSGMDGMIDALERLWQGGR